MKNIERRQWRNRLNETKVRDGEKIGKEENGQAERKGQQREIRLKWEHGH